MFKRLREDIKNIREKDPSVTSSLEIIFLYPGLKALRRHRRAKWFYNRKMFFWARLISQRAAKKFGIEIHPAATIGRRVFIDHGVGVVIGATAIIGNDVIIYQGVTLGGTGKDTGKRHPTVGNNVMIGAGAKVLGPILIGDNARIAAGAVVLADVPAKATAVGVPARIARLDGAKINLLDQMNMPDPIAHELIDLEARIKQLENLQKGSAE